MTVCVFYLSCVVYYAVYGLVIILCLYAVGCLTGYALVVTIVFVVLLYHDLKAAESRVKVWRQ